MSEPNHELDNQKISAEVYHYSPEQWDRVKPDVFELLKSANSEGITNQTKEDYEKYFTVDDSYWLRVLLKNAGKIIGFTLVHPEQKQRFNSDNGVLKSELYNSSTMAEVETTYIAKEFQHRGLVGKLMSTAEEELRARGFNEMYRRVRSDNGYADAIERHYGDKIASKTIVTPHLTQFVIKL